MERAELVVPKSIPKTGCIQTAPEKNNKGGCRDPPRKRGLMSVSTGHGKGVTTGRRWWVGTLKKIQEDNRRLFDVEQLHFKDQRGVAGDGTHDALLPIGKIRWAFQFGFSASFHHLQSFCPALDYAAQLEFHG